MGKALDWLGPDGCRSVSMGLLRDSKDCGSYILARCPFHGEETLGAFRYYPDRDDAVCHGCQHSSDLIGVFNVVNGMDEDSGDGFRAFRDRYAADQPMEPADRKPRPKRQVWAPSPGESPRRRWQRQAYKFFEFCRRKIWDHPDVLEWLASQRGLDANAVKRFAIGWNPKRAYRPRAAWGLPAKYWEDGRERKLMIRKGLVLCRFAGDELIRLRIRRADDESGPKYCMVDGSKNRPVLINPDSPVFVVVESELDAYLVAERCGPGIGVCAMTAVKIKPDSEMHEALLQARRILVALDAEERVAREAYEWWEATYGGRVKRWPVPQGKDPGEYFADHGGDIAAWVSAALSPGLRAIIERKAGVRKAGVALSSSHPEESPKEKKFRQAVEDVRRLMGDALADDLIRFRELYPRCPVKLCSLPDRSMQWVELTDARWIRENPELAAEVDSLAVRVFEVIEFYWPELIVEKREMTLTHE